MPTKNIRFDYFKPALDSNPATECILTPYMQVLAAIPFEQRVMGYFSGHSIRLGHIERHLNYQPENGNAPFPFELWQLTFNRIRPDVPGVTKINNPDLAPLALPEDEYIAEDSTALYDPLLNYLVVQRNRTGVPPSAMQKFLNSMSRTNDPIHFQTAQRQDALNRALSHSFHQSINLRIVNTSNPNVVDAAQTNDTISHIIRTAATLATDQDYPIQADLVLTLPGRNPERTMRHTAYSALMNVANRLIANDSVDKLVIKGRNDEESPLEEVDLIQDAIRDWLSFNVDTGRFISSVSIFDQLAIAYRDRRPSLPTPPPVI